MPRPPNISPVLTASDGWMVSIPGSMTATGKRRRKFFGDAKARAEKFASRIRRIYHKGERQTLLTPEQATQAAQALKLLDGTGISLIEAARAVVRQREECGTETLRERWARFSDEMEGHWRLRYALDMARIPRWVPSIIDRCCHELKPAAVREAVIAGGAKAETTIAMRVSRVLSVLSSRGKKRKGTKIAILKPWQRWRLVRLCKSEDDRRVMALLLYAGIRPDAEDGEISRLDWSNVRRSEIYIPESVSKTGSDRHIPITPRLARMITGHPKTGQVLTSGWRRRWQSIRKDAGIAKDQDITRHTFGSHFLAAMGEHEAKQAMGHTRDSDTIFRHYRRAVTTRRGRRYFGILTKQPPTE